MPISMTPELYFEAFVQGNHDDFIRNPSCIRRAFNAAVAASHLADHYFQYYTIHDPTKISSYNNIGSYVEAISQSTNGYFQDIRSISNAYKHLYTGIDHRRGQYSSISSAGTLENVQLLDEEIEELYEDYSEQESPLVVYTTKRGHQRQFRTALEAVFEFWKNQFI